MKTLISIVCCVLAVRISYGDGICIIGSKYIRPNRPYSVALWNTQNKNIKLNITLQCDDGEFSPHTSLFLTRKQSKTHEFRVPSIDPNSYCTFRAVNAGGDVEINEKVELLMPDKTVSIFIQTDKPVYKPGDELRFRVVVVDIETKPVTNIKTIEVNIEDSRGDSVRQWKFAKLNKGIFETRYQMAAAPVLGTWTLSATVNDNGIVNEKRQSFNVMEYVLPKFSVKAWPTRTLVVEDKKISLNVEARYTFGQRVEGKLEVNLYSNKYSKRATHTIKKDIKQNAMIEFSLEKKLTVEANEEFTLVNMTAGVTDSLTNATVSVNQSVPVYLQLYKISLITTSLYPPGAKYGFKVSVRDHSGLPPEQEKDIKVSVDGDEISGTLNSQGLAYFVITTPEDAEPIEIKATYDNREYDLGAINGSQHATSKYLQIRPKDSIIVGTRSFTVSSNEFIGQFTYFVVTRGSIVVFNTIRPGQRKTYTLKLKLTEAMAPKAILMVFTTDNVSFISDHIELNFESFSNDFEFHLSEDSYRPDENIYIEGKAQRDSLVFFHAIDQSALLLGHTEYGITKQGVLDDLGHYDGYDRENSQDWFGAIGLFIKGTVPALGPTTSNRRKRSIIKTTQKPVLLRTNYPEAWLWRNHSMGKSDTFEITDSVPDTITSWDVTGFALSPTRGLGIMNHPRQFTVGKSFYMIAHLPYSIKRNEVALIQVTLYNFLGNEVTTDVTLYNKRDEIEFVEKSSNDDTRRSKAILLPSHQVKQMSFLIKAKKLGEIAIKIEAVNDLTSDGLEHTLRVTPESHPYKKNSARFIELDTFKTMPFDITLDIPRDADPGSTKIVFAIDHNLIGLPTKYAESLINIPKGSGDLNLLTLIPNVVALDFLDAITSENVTETVKQKAVDFLNQGYDNQLKYRSTSGAFRQLITNTDNESVFLTALVANSFVIAAKHIKVDAAVINGAFSWLAGKQSKWTGCFVEVGEVFYSPIQGSSIALTAFVVAAIRENPGFHSEYKSLVDNAVKCLADNFSSLPNDFQRGLASYALSLADHPNKLDYYNELIKHSIRSEDNKRYWNEGSLSIDTAGYALLSSLALNKVMQARGIFDWLNGQRYSSGEFAGVQSTFVGLKAIGKMAQILGQTPIDYNVKLTYTEDNTPKTKTFDMDKPKALQVTEMELLDTIRNIHIEFSGIGYGMFQVSYQYHQNIALGKQIFELNTTLLATSTYDVQNLKVCLKYKQKEAYQNSNQAVVEVHLPSGLFANDNAVQDLSPEREIKDTKRKFDGSAIYVYYNSVSSTRFVCFEVTARRQFKIALHRPAHVVVYDLENRDDFAIKTYEGKVLGVCDICEDKDCKTLKC